MVLFHRVCLDLLLQLAINSGLAPSLASPSLDPVATYIAQPGRAKFIMRAHLTACTCTLTSMYAFRPPCLLQPLCGILTHMNASKREAVCVYVLSFQSEWAPGMVGRLLYVYMSLVRSFVCCTRLSICPMITRRRRGVATPTGHV